MDRDVIFVDPDIKARAAAKASSAPRSAISSFADDRKCSSVSDCTPSIDL